MTASWWSTLPLVAGAVGCLTNWIAVRLLFWPRRFVGVGPIGWQGVVHRHYEKFAQTLGELAGTHLIGARDVVERIDVDGLERLYEGELDARIRQVLAACAESLGPGTWERLDEATRAAIVRHARREARGALEELLDELVESADKWLDIRAIAIETLSAERGGALARIFREFAARELDFVVAYGGIVGLFIGSTGFLCWALLGQWWLIPVFGGVVGALTNWLAILMIFRPHVPRRLLGLRVQGLLLRHRDEIAADFARIASRKVLTPSALIERCTQRETADWLIGRFRRVVRERLEDQTAMLQLALPADADPALLPELRADVQRRIEDALPEIRKRVEPHLEAKLQLGGVLEERIRALPASAFEEIFRGVTREEEPTLIALGAGLGALIGLIHGLAVFA